MSGSPVAVFYDVQGYCIIENLVVDRGKVLSLIHI